jgi:parallel beta-helix repeat protein
MVREISFIKSNYKSDYGKMESMKRILAIGIILLFIGMSISSSTGFNVYKASTTTFNGKTLYVGGNGTGNYTKIQDAIDDASDGDTVFVYNDSSPYYAYLIVDKSISLIGEDRNSTVIETDGVTVEETSNTTINGFTLTSGYPYTVNFFSCSDCTFTNNNVFSTTVWGIAITESNRINISNNFFTGIGNSIYVFHSINCLIFNNIITGNTSDLITRGIFVSSSINVTVIHNYVSLCWKGICIQSSESVCVVQNNIIKNRKGASFYYSPNFKKYIVLWDDNYWGRQRLFPYPIRGRWIIIPFWNFDWHPALKPYPIEV